MSVTISGLLAIVCYLLGGLGQGLRLKRVQAIPQAAIQLLAALGFLLQAHTLYLQLHTVHGINLNLFTVGSLAAWLVVGLTWLACLRQPLQNLQVLLLPLAALVQAGALLLSGPEDIVRIDSARLLHILASVTAYSFFTIAACQALLLAYQDRQLKARHPRGLLHLFPPLQTMEQLLFALIWIGMTLLSLSLASGFIILDDMFAQHLAHRTLLSVFAWLVFAVLLWGRHQLGWRGQIAIRWTLIGFLLLMLAYFGSKFVLDLLGTAG